MLLQVQYNLFNAFSTLKIQIFPGINYIQNLYCSFKINIALKYIIYFYMSNKVTITMDNINFDHETSF